MSDDPLVSIGVFARRSRLSMKALRLYDRLGLLRPAHVDPANGYRRYRESQLATARLVVMLRRLDVPLAQVAELVSAPGPRAAELLEAYWGDVERRVAGQRELLAHVRTRLLGGSADLADLAIQERDVPEQLVLTAKRHLPVEELAGWIGTTTARLVTTAQQYGGVTGACFVVYYGDVDEDGDGPAEVCVPVSVPAEDAALRREPAHREAYVRLRKAQVAFPQILSAYDAVAQWVAAEGLTIDGPPREVYFTDFISADPADEVCDVAFPVKGRPNKRAL